MSTFQFSPSSFFFFGYTESSSQCRGLFLVAMPGLRFDTACRILVPWCGILVPWPGIEPMSPALEGRFLTTGAPEKSCIFIEHQACAFVWRVTISTSNKQRIKSHKKKKKKSSSQVIQTSNQVGNQYPRRVGDLSKVTSSWQSLDSSLAWTREIRVSHLTAHSMIQCSAWK